ncbi:hypothetical protein PI124_g18397 [Phytophthora idaei]|nr:hypothetical protein PI125_g23837 [Phytophthora idaei]KAG3127437.1 hypothetical protein PI126_g21849 [Phytophthora idaei]KAG3236592.1 hypothetical protein PI124_g18397 [Phytophthora idaei]
MLTERQHVCPVKQLRMFNTRRTAYKFIHGRESLGSHQLRKFNVGLPKTVTYMLPTFKGHMGREDFLGNKGEL